MSTDNPYTSPGRQPIAAPPRVNASSQPSGFMAICVIMTILGVMGTLGSVLGIVGLIAAPALQSLAEARKPGQPQAQHDLEVEMQREIAQVTDHWRPFTFAIVTVHLLVSIAILTGAIFCMRRNPTGLGLLSYGSMAAIGYEVINVGVQIVVNMQTYPITARFLQKTVENAPGNAPPEMAKMMGTTMQAVMWMTIGFLIFWTVAKLIADVATILFLQKPEFQQYVGKQAERTSAD